MKNRRALIFAMLCAILAIALIYTYINSFETKFESKYKKINVVMAKKDIRPNIVLNESHFQEQLIPKPYIQPGAVLAEDLADILSLLPVSQTTIKEGEQLLRTKVDLFDDAKVSSKIPKGYRACTIAINSISGVGGHIRTGDHIDVIGTFRTLNEQRVVKDLQAVTLLQDVAILAAGSENRFQKILDASQSDKGAFSSTRGGAARAANHLTLLLTPRDCMDLAIAQQVGSLTASLRSFQERNVGKAIKALKEKKSTTKSVTGLEQQVQIQSVPSWIEVRGEQGAYVQ